MSGQHALDQFPWWNRWLIAIKYHANAWRGNGGKRYRGVQRRLTFGDVGNDAGRLHDGNFQPFGPVFPFLASELALQHQVAGALAILARPVSEVRGQRGVGHAGVVPALVARPFARERVFVRGP